MAPPLQGSDRAISPVVGAALMLVIVVALATTVGVLILGFSDVLSGPPPFVASEESVRVRIAGNETRHTLELVHEGGEPVAASALVLAVTTGGTTIRTSGRELGGPALADGRWTAGERLNMPLNESVVCDTGSGAATVELRYRGAERSYTLSSQTVPVERGQFVIDGANVRGTVPYTANVKFVGTAWSSPSYDARVNVTVHVDGTTVKAWRMVRDTTNVVGSYGISRQDVGTSVEVRAAGEQCGYFCRYFGASPSWVRVSSTTNTENVRVYRDGDSAPSFESAGGQAAVAAYVDPYVEDGRVTLDDNQAIYLFDFNDDDHDYQDAVVLVSFFTQRQHAGVYRSAGRDVILCPAETRSASPNGGGNGPPDGGN